MEPCTSTNLRGGSFDDCLEALPTTRPSTTPGHVDGDLHIDPKVL